MTVENNESPESPLVMPTGKSPFFRKTSSDSTKKPRTPSQARNRNRWFLYSGIAGAIALLAAGAVGGWWAANRTLIAHASSGAERSGVGEGVLFDLPSGNVMPDVRGLDRDDAARVLADSGFASSMIEFTDEPSAAPVGTVVTQVPGYGQENPAKITIGVAAPTTMPDMVGWDRERAVSALSALGVSAQLAFQYSSSVKPGVVIATTPGGSEPLSGDVTVTLATAGSTVELSQVSTLGRRGCSTSTTKAGGVQYRSAVVCSVRGNPVTTVWLPDGKTDRLTGTLGIDDTAPAGSSAHVQILVNGVPVLDQDVAFGKAVNVDLPTTGALQLSMVVSSATETQVVFGGAVLHGAEGAIAELSTR